MPYGYPKRLGGDSPANDSRMEVCVQQVMKRGADKVSAIRICKASLEKAGR